jgi:hypothetical protein
MSEAYSGVGHELLNPFGERIYVSKITFRTLDMRGYLQRDDETGLKQIKPSLIHFFLQLERTTYHRELYTALGPDFSGPSTVSCSCRECQGKIPDNTRLPGRNKLEDDKVIQIVREVKASRRYAA